MAAPVLPRVKTRVAEQSAAASPWGVLGLASVVFDVDQGQTLQDVWPPACLPPACLAAVSFHAFPDSLSMELHSRNAVRDSSFTFRIKHEPCSNSSAPDWVWGYVFCRQRQDERLRRGGEQASVVVLSSHPFGSALLPLSAAAGHAFFSEGARALPAIWDQVQAWPAPVPGGRLSLAAGSGTISARLPHFSIMPLPQPVPDPAVQASLARRASRTLSLKAGSSPRAAAVAAAAGGSFSLPTAGSGGDSASAGAAQQGAGSREGSQHSTADSAAGDAAAPAAAGSAAAEDGGWSIVSNEVPQQQQQQQQQQDAGVLLSRASSSSSSRLSRPELSLESASSPLSPISPGLANGGASGSGGSSSEALAAQLGPQWREETPFPEVDTALVLAPLLPHLWTLWQLLVTAQPLLVVGLTPGDTSAAVAALLNLVAPLPFAADARPYFTIHDPDFVALAAGKLPRRRLYHETVPPPPPQQQQQQPDQPPPCDQQQPDQPAPCDRQQPLPGAAVPAAGAGAQQAACGDAQGERGQGLGQEQQQQQPAQALQDMAAPSTASPQQQQQQAAAPKPAPAPGYDLPVVLGITNLYFIRALPSFPNVVAVSRKDPAAAAAQQAARTGGGARGDSPSRAASAGGAAASDGGPTAPPAASRLGSASGLLSATAAAAVRALQRRHHGPQSLLSHFAPHLWTRHKGLLRPDSALLSKLRSALEPPAAGPASGTAAGAAVASRQLRRHFAELTAAFLAPFEPYFRPGADGKVPAWRPEAFLSGLTPAALHPALAARLAGSAATTAAVLYGAFLESPHFASWFAARRAPVMHLVEQAPDEHEDDGFAQVAAGEAAADDELMLVERLLAAEEALGTSQAQQLGSPAGLEQQQQELVASFTSLPQDLQAALAATPARRAMLAAAADALAGAGDGDGVVAPGQLAALRRLLTSSA